MYSYKAQNSVILFNRHVSCTRGSETDLISVIVCHGVLARFSHGNWSELISLKHYSVVIQSRLKKVCRNNKTTPFLK